MSSVYDSFHLTKVFDGKPICSTEKNNFYRRGSSLSACTKGRIFGKISSKIAPFINNNEVNRTVAKPKKKIVKRLKC